MRLDTAQSSVARWNSGGDPRGSNADKISELYAELFPAETYSRPQTPNIGRIHEDQEGAAWDHEAYQEAVRRIKELKDRKGIKHIPFDEYMDALDDFYDQAIADRMHK